MITITITILKTISIKTITKTTKITILQQVGRALGVEHKCNNNPARRLHQKQLGHQTVSKFTTLNFVSKYLRFLV